MFKRPFAILLLVATLSLSAWTVTGCGSASIPVLSVLPSPQQYCDAGQAMPFTASIANDPANSGVTWSVSGGGTLSAITATTVLYTAPATLSATAAVKLTATSVEDPAVSATASIQVSPPPAIATTTLANGVANTAYSATLATSGGVAPYSWAITAGSLPTGLTLNATTGVIAGTPTVNGASTFSVTLTDFSTPQLSATSSFTLVVGQTLSVTNASVPDAEYGIPYSAALAVSGGASPYVWSMSAGALPAGLSLSGAGILSGTPTSSGSFTFTAQAGDAGSPPQKASKTFTFSVAPQLVVSTATTLPAVAIHNAYSVTLTTSGGTGVSTWSLANGSTLPAGLSLSAAGVISGTPTAPGTSTFSVKATDAGVPPQTATKLLSLTIAPALSITTATLNAAASGSFYTAALQSTGGTAPITWSLIAGSALPSGMSLNASTGVISGTPSSVGTYPLTVQAADASAPQQTATASLTLNVTATATLQITSLNLPAAIAGGIYNATAMATGGVAPLTWKVSAGALPNGLTLDTATGIISGTAAASGITAFSLQVKDSETTPMTATMAYTFVVYPPIGSSVNDGEIKGSYAFLFQGFHNGSAAGKVYGLAAIGSLSADGSGNLTGVEDGNSETGAVTQVNISGVYGVGSDQRGLMALSDGTTVHTFAISVIPASAGAAQKILFIEFDDTATTAAASAIGTGVARLQTPAAFLSDTITGSFVFGMQGETPCTSCGSAILPFGPIDAAGVFTGDGNGNITGGQQDAGGVHTAYTGITLTGSYTLPSATTGRGTMKLTPAASSLYPAAPVNYIFYIVSANEILLMSSDSHATATLLSGDAQLQQLPVFNNGSIAGSLIAYEAGSSGGDGATQYPNTANATLSLLAVTGAGTASLQQDSLQGSVFSSAGPTAATYAVAANGRMTLSEGGTVGEVFYFANGTQGFGVELPQPAGTPALIRIEAQTQVSGRAPLLSGGFGAAALPSAAPAIMQSGRAAFTPNSGGLNSSFSGDGSILLDTSGTALALLSAQAQSILYLESANGRTTVSTPSSSVTIGVMYTVTPSEAIEIAPGADSTSVLTILER